MREESFSPEPFEIIHSLEFGATAAIRLIIEELGLSKAMYSRKEQWVEDVIAMIAGKLTYQSSKLGLCNLHEVSSVWKQAGVMTRPDVEILVTTEMAKRARSRWLLGWCATKRAAHWPSKFSPATPRMRPLFQRR